MKGHIRLQTFAKSGAETGNAQVNTILSTRNRIRATIVRAHTHTQTRDSHTRKHARTLSLSHTLTNVTEERHNSYQTLHHACTHTQTHRNSHHWMIGRQHLATQVLELINRTPITRIRAAREPCGASLGPKCRNKVVTVLLHHEHFIHTDQWQHLLHEADLARMHAPARQGGPLFTRVA